MAALVMGIALGACVLSFSLAMRTVNTASNQMTGLHYARNQVEMLRTNHFTNAVLNAGSYTISNANFTGSYLVTNIDIWTKNLTVNVAYRNRIRGANSTNTLATTLTTSLHP